MDNVLEKLRAQGERLTIQRRLVIEALCNAENHLTINAIQDHIAANHPDSDMQDPTIYRILQWLKDLQIISQTDMGQTGIVYELLDTPPHHHLICLKCNQVIDIDNAFFSELRQQLYEKYGFAARIDHMAIYGYCEVCAKTEIKTGN